MNLKEYIIKKYKKEIMESIAVDFEQTIDNIKDEILGLDDEIIELKKEIEIMKLYIIDLQNKNILGEKK
jgi:DNA polymerase III epsilon subunit-like protein